MQLTITRRIFLAMLTAVCLAVISLVLIMKWSMDRGFLRYVNERDRAGLVRLVGKLERFHAGTGGFETLRNNQEAWRNLISESFPEGDGPPPMAGHPPPHPASEEPLHPPPHLSRRIAHDIGQRFFLLDAARRSIAGPLDIPATAPMTAVRSGGRIVGYAGILPLTRIMDDAQKRFIRDQQQAFVIVSGVMVLLAAGLSLLLARRLVRPLRELAQATHRLTAGDFTTRVLTGGRDELGMLAADFNMLALTLEKNEQSRRQWVADISHELRTPLAVLRGEIEALHDGIRLPDAKTLHSLQSEILRMGRLVDDLYQLSMSDLGALTYKKTRLDMATLLSETITSYRPEFAGHNLKLLAQIPPLGSCWLFGDAGRLQQLMANILGNSLKYTDTGGTQHLAMQCLDDAVIVDFQDSAPGVPENEHERLFDRLYRVESSRNRATGGAGLGLAICRNIVEAHGGRITASPSPLGGLWIRVELPRGEKQ